MPNYVFRCTCEIEHVRAFSMSDVPAISPCPDCGNDAQRVIRWDGGTVLKGGGWAKHAARDTANHKRGAQ